MIIGVQALEQIFGGSPAAVLIRLIIISMIVGIILAALGLDAFDIYASIKRLAQNIYNLGFEAFEWILRYFVVGAVLVFPIWGAVRLFKVLTKSDNNSGK